ncbi:RNA-binding S4 domain-containing protein [Vallitalea pronyensis]|uniref:RNA-binding S4 domain-containing protein n=1 Tax=Vallitalea pronyensis TaxID=1348613 RepID=A0A8J8MGI6_9FIRM|nr:RNA-binding S4 domain-containing protein [Vallitalea pronyensis]QUI21082.1 RNA-binding S4 domain-containing protein [Vallitalea pronyensis]
MENIAIDTAYIKLGQLLKLAGIADSGVHAKILIMNEEVRVNGQVMTQRGKKIYPEDHVSVKGFGEIKVTK